MTFRYIDEEAKVYFFSRQWSRSVATLSILIFFTFSLNFAALID